jgi:hypothetical protein
MTAWFGWTQWYWWGHCDGHHCHQDWSWKMDIMSLCPRSESLWQYIINEIWICLRYTRRLCAQLTPTLTSIWHYGGRHSPAAAEIILAKSQSWNEQLGLLVENVCMKFTWILPAYIASALLWLQNGEVLLEIPTGTDVSAPAHLSQSKDHNRKKSMTYFKNSRDKILSPLPKSGYPGMSIKRTGTVTPDTTNCPPRCGCPYRPTAPEPITVKYMNTYPKFSRNLFHNISICSHPSWIA